ncbi:MAG: D-alanyl-D-alanine carboxypeptidase/D-alanyl-D-alanine endopeptidase, partial [Nocardioidaceae bacterium]
GVVLLVLAVAAASYQWDLGTRLGIAAPAPAAKAAGLRLPAVVPAAEVAAATPAGSIDPAAVRRALAGLVDTNVLGHRVALDVAQLSDGLVVFSSGPAAITPASTMKLLTTTAALQALGPDHRFTTSTVLSGDRVTLVGGGDPLLEARPAAPGASYPAHVAELTSLARSTARALTAQGVTRVRLSYDVSLFTGPAVDPQWPRGYVPDGVVSPIEPLWVDEGRVTPGHAARSPDPARAAATRFARMLTKAGVAVRGSVRSAAAPAGSSSLAAVRSAPLEEIVQHTLETSDNEAAEVLARQVALAQGRPGSFVAGVAAVRRALGGLGIPTAGDLIYDGSGLSRHDRLRPATLLAVLQKGSTTPALRSVVTDLPVAGFTGSLAYRFADASPWGLGRVRAKTGTLTGVSGLAGTVTSRDGVVMSFVAVADRVSVPKTLDARDALDGIAAALAACRCASHP